MLPGHDKRIENEYARNPKLAEPPIGSVRMVARRARSTPRISVRKSSALNFSYPNRSAENRGFRLYVPARLCRTRKIR